MKKFRALSVIFAAMMLTSCSSKSGDADNSNIHLPVSPGLSSSSASDDNLETTPAVITEAAKKFKFGTVTDGVYKSEYNGIQFKAPDGWIYATSEQIAKMNDMDKDYLSLAQEQVTSKVAGLTSIYDMQCAEKTGSNILVMYENITASGNDPAKYTIDDYGKSLQATLESVQKVTYKLENTSSIELAGKTFTKYDYSCTMTGSKLKMNQIYYVCKTDDFIMSIILSINADTEKETDFEKLFSAIG
ncbi:MAG: hypothetical protein LKG21_03320 [Ruminococcus sp.]|jgi:hypothetical protein|nr:hypothetical protein [Ruminococcus sp.]